MLNVSKMGKYYKKIKHNSIIYNYINTIFNIPCYLFYENNSID